MIRPLGYLIYPKRNLSTSPMLDGLDGFWQVDLHARLVMRLLAETLDRTELHQARQRLSQISYKRGQHQGKSAADLFWYRLTRPEKLPGTKESRIDETCSSWRPVKYFAWPIFPPGVVWVRSDGCRASDDGDKGRLPLGPKRCKLDDPTCLVRCVVDVLAVLA